MSTPRRHRWWQAAAMTVAGGLTIALTQNTTTAAFTGQTSDTGNSVGAAADFCTSPGTSTLIATADTAVYQANPTANYGATTGIGVGSGVGANAYSYVKFTLPASLPAGCILTSAVLRVYASQSQAATISASRASVAWNGATITWNTVGKPVSAGTPVNVAMPGVVGFQQWTVTTLTEELMAGPDYGFMLKDSVDNAASPRYQTWDSIEAATSTQRPRLILTWG